MRVEGLTPDSLNPCCNGRWSRTLKQDVNEVIVEVLILVVMEDGLVPRVK